LEDGLLVLLPPTFANCGVVIAETKKVAYYWKCTWDFGEIFDESDIRRGEVLWM
jgi:hypothetical protein